MEKSSVLDVTLHNVCPLPFTLEDTGERTFQNKSDIVRIERNATFPLHVRMGAERKTLTLNFTVLNSQIRSREHLEIALTGPVGGK